MLSNAETTELTLRGESPYFRGVMLNHAKTKEMMLKEWSPYF